MPFALCRPFLTTIAINSSPRPTCPPPTPAQFMKLTTNSDTSIEKIKTLEKQAEEAAASVKALQSVTKQLQVTAFMLVFHPAENSATARGCARFMRALFALLLVACFFWLIHRACMQSEAQLASKHMTDLHQDYHGFKDQISPKFAPLEHDVSVINGVLQLDAQKFNEKVLPLPCVCVFLHMRGAPIFSSLRTYLLVLAVLLPS